MTKVKEIEGILWQIEYLKEKDLKNREQIGKEIGILARHGFELLFEGKT